MAHSPRNFADHELLEALLFYSLPRINTNEIAHRLLNEFGSLKAIVNAPPERLMSVEGIGVVTAQHIQLISELYQRMQRQKFFPHARLDTLSALGEFAITYLGSENAESLCAILLDGEMRLIEMVTLSRGSRCQTAFDAAALTRTAVLKNAANVCLAHNHPGGTAQPSVYDKAITANAQRALGAIGITLIEHIIVNEVAYSPTMQARLASTATLGRSNAEIQFFKHFYQN